MKDKIYRWIKVEWEKERAMKEDWIQDDYYKLVDEQGLLQVTTTGYLLKETADEWYIAQSQAEGLLDTQYSGIIIIPRKMITKITPIED